MQEPGGCVSADLNPSKGGRVGLATCQLPVELCEQTSFPPEFVSLELADSNNVLDSCTIQIGTVVLDLLAI